MTVNKLLFLPFYATKGQKSSTYRTILNFFQRSSSSKKRNDSLCRYAESRSIDNKKSPVAKIVKATAAS